MITISAGFAPAIFFVLLRSNIWMTSDMEKHTWKTTWVCRIQINRFIICSYMIPIERLPFIWGYIPCLQTRISDQTGSVHPWKQLHYVPKRVPWHPMKFHAVSPRICVIDSTANFRCAMANTGRGRRLRWKSIFFIVQSLFRYWLDGCPEMGVVRKSRGVECSTKFKWFNGFVWRWSPYPKKYVQRKHEGWIGRSVGVVYLVVLSKGVQTNPHLSFSLFNFQVGKPQLRM